MEKQVFAGSCLCGAVTYRIEGEAETFWHCHCLRCRKATGTGHASNVIVRLASCQWTQGESLLRRYNVPGAKRFHSLFCSECGGPMPRVSTDRGIAVIPAGTLDEHPALQPTGRIFQDSRSDWSCGGDELPHWDQYPVAPET